jgi:probable rRNA maturation factor
VIDIDVEGRELAPDGPTDDEIRTALELAFASAGVGAGHVAVHFVDEARSHELAAEYLGKDDATDVISFPVDGEEAAGVGDVEELVLELGDIVICPERTEDLLETIVHGGLHLVGMDHETDEGQMLVVQAELMGWLR